MCEAARRAFQLVLVNKVIIVISTEAKIKQTKNYRYNVQCISFKVDIISMVPRRKFNLRKAPKRLSVFPLYLSSLQRKKKLFEFGFA